MIKAICLLCLVLMVSGSTVFAQSGKTPKTPSSKESRKTDAKKKTATIQYGTASFYSNKFNGRKTANGELYDQHKLTAAHNCLPLNTWIKVTNMRNGRSVIVKVNDRLN